MNKWSTMDEVVVTRAAVLGDKSALAELERRDAVLAHDLGFEDVAAFRVWLNEPVTAHNE